MRTRAYRPEAPACLEERSLLSGVAGLSANPVVLTRRQFTQVVDFMHLGFYNFTQYRDVEHLREDLRDVAVIIPFGRVDGLGVSINRIVDRMEEDISAKVPHPVRSALIDVLAATRAEVAARVRAGDVVLR
jgi:hypothetical protein